MLKTLLVLFITISSALAQDRSGQERYEDAYRTQADGTSVYVGKCQTHEDYEGINFSRSSLVMDTLYPGQLSALELKRRLLRLDSQLLQAIAKNLQFDLADFKDFVDDITIDRIQLSKRLTSNLIRANVGIGGGNGSFLVFTQVGRTYELMSRTLDGDLEYCDDKVWMKSSR